MPTAVSVMERDRMVWGGCNPALKSHMEQIEVQSVKNKSHVLHESLSTAQ